MLNRFVFCALIIVVWASLGFAQTTTNSDDYHKFEVFGGYSNNQVDTGLPNYNNDVRGFFGDRETFHGFEVSAVGNVNRYVGIKASISGHFKDYEFNVPVSFSPPITNRLEIDSSIYNFLGGVQVKDNAKEGSRFRPFAHALIGVAHRRNEFSGSFCQQPNSGCDQSSTGFAAAIGGGIDIKATKRLSIRAFQFDYNPNRLNDTTKHNFRFGFGLVFH